MSSGSTSGLLSSSATIARSSVSVPGWYNPVETEVDWSPTPFGRSEWARLAIVGIVSV